MRLRAKANRGSSLVEILVVMVVLVVGILTIVRLYPPGFRTVRHAECVTMAGRLAQYEIERWKNNSENLPDGMLPIDSNGNAINDRYPGPPVDDDNAECFRRVIGETTRIPFGGWTNGELNGSIYVLAFSPVDVSRGIVVRGSNLTRRLMDSGNNSKPWEFLRSSQYAIDYDNLQVCFPESDQGRIFYLACSWWETPGGGGSPHLRTATDIKISVPANTESWISFSEDSAYCTNGIGSRISSGHTYAGLDRYSDTVARGFVDAGPTGWTSDPYEYKIVDPLLGIIGFNPAGYSQKEFGRPLLARIDYDIYDLQIIHEDKRIPANSPYRVHMTLNRIKESGQSMELDGDTYKGIHPPTIPYDMIAVDLETGLQVGFDSSWINYKDGIVEFPSTINLLPIAGIPGRTISPAGRDIRFYYKAEGDWSLQFQKAYTQYERDYNTSALDYKSYAIDDVNKPERLWFSACNANQTVSVDYEYTLNGNPRRVLGECHKTSDALYDYGGVKSTYIDLKNTPTRITSVNGVSIKARVIWRETEKWRRVDLDSIITRGTTD